MFRLLHEPHQHKRSKRFSRCRRFTGFNLRSISKRKVKHSGPNAGVVFDDGFGEGHVSITLQL